MKGTQSYPAGLGSQAVLGLSKIPPLKFQDLLPYMDLTESEPSSGNASDLDCLDDLRG